MIFTSRQLCDGHYPGGSASGHLPDEFWDVSVGPHTQQGGVQTAGPAHYSPPRRPTRGH